MKINSISKKFHNSGLLIENTYLKKNIQSLSKKKISEYFHKHGFLYFKNFKINNFNFIKFADKYTLKYANDAGRRKVKFNNKKIMSVDLGNSEIPLHSEASFSPSWPEIIWFYCSTPSKKSGFTTIIDGVKIYENLSLSTKKFFLANQIRYKLLIPFKKTEVQKKIKLNIKKKTKLKNWLLPFAGTSQTKINLKESFIQTNFNRYAINALNKSQQLTFCNHLLPAIYKDEPQILDFKMSNGKPIPQKIIQEIKNVTNKLIYKIKWNKGDFCMIDNRRFMHGRTKISTKEKRDISVVQTLISKFY